MFSPMRQLLDPAIYSSNQKFYMSMFESKSARRNARKSLLRYNKRVSTLDPDHAKDMPIDMFADVMKNPKSRVFMWGQACFGALGTPSAVYRPLTKKPPRRQLDIPTRCATIERFNVRDLACGYGFTIFVVNEKHGQIMGTGINKDGQIPYYSASEKEPFEVLIRPAFIKLPTQENVSHVAAGRSHCLALTKSGVVFSMGNNSYGQCGRPIIKDEDYFTAKIIHEIKFTEKQENDKIINIVCGMDHSLFLTESGRVYSCGLGSDGQTGLGHYNCQASPSQVIGDVKNEKIVKVACAGDCVLSLNDNGEVFGWGNTEYDQFRCVTDEQQIHTPVHLKLEGVGKVIDVAAGGTSCMVLNENGDVFVWGFGILGGGPKLTQTVKPVPLPRPLFGKNDWEPNTYVTSIACGIGSNAAINSKGDLYTWGRNRNSCLGLQSRQDQLFPFKVHMGDEVRKVSLGLDHSGALCRPFV